MPKRAYTLEELRLNRIQPQQFLAPTDSTLNGVRTTVQAAYLAGLTATYFAQLLDLAQIVQVGAVQGRWAGPGQCWRPTLLGAVGC